MVLSRWLGRCRFGPWFVEPVIAGLEGPECKPWVSAMDLVGAPVFTSDFVLSGTCSANMYGMCESLYRPDMVSALSPCTPVPMQPAKARFCCCAGYGCLHGLP